MKRKNWKWTVLAVCSGGLVLQGGCGLVIADLAYALVPTIIQAVLAAALGDTTTT